MLWKRCGRDPGREQRENFSPLSDKTKKDNLEGVTWPDSGRSCKTRKDQRAPRKVSQKYDIY